MLATRNEELSTVFDNSPVWGAVVFGSVAAGNSDSISDIDIMVFSDKTLEYTEYMNLYMDINELIDRDIDLVDYSTAKNPLLKSVRDNHIVVYGDETRIKNKLKESITDEPLYIKDKNSIPKSRI